MSSFALIGRFGNCVIGSHKTVLYTRNAWHTPLACNYTKKSAEARLGIDKPKRPLNPFFKFMSQMRPALLAKNPGISSKEAIAWTSKHWQELDADTKAQMNKEYEKDKEDYKKIMAIYQASLTDEQKADIKKKQEELNIAKEKRKTKAEYKELGRPKKPMSSYILFMIERKEGLVGTNFKDFASKVKNEWAVLPANDKQKYMKKAKELLVKYKKDLQAWELKMISQGRIDLVKGPVQAKKSKEKSQ